MRLNIYFSTLLLLMTSFAIGQEIDKSNTRSGEDVEYCGQHKIQGKLMQDPVFRKQFEADQESLKLLEDQITRDPFRKRGTIYTIPVVFHVIHNGGVSNISRTQIQDAMDILNRDFRKKNADAADVHSDFQGMPSDVEIQFVFATKAPNGVCFSGITRTYSTSTDVTGKAQVQVVQAGNDIFKGEWTGNKYLNIFVADAIEAGAGYTFNPYGNGNSMSNGIWITHNYLGSIGTSNINNSRALTHEVGHWLNLAHTWGPNNSPGDPNSCSIDDGVTDTPNTVGVTWCNLNEATCGVRANVENYMDYSYCSKMFTPGQVSRMRAAIQSGVGGRNNLWTTLNLSQVGSNVQPICAANFSPMNSQACAGSNIVFNDESYNTPKTWSWSFPGGTPSTSNLQNPIVKYDTPGVYSATLTVSDGTITKTITKDNVITIYAKGRKIPFLESFDDLYELSNSSFWSTSNTIPSSNYRLTNDAAYTGTKSVMLNNFDLTGANTFDLISGAFDLSQVQSQSNVTLSFKYAYRKKQSANSEILRVYLSNDCGASWNLRRAITGNILSNQVVATSWVPSDLNEWVIIHLTNISSSFWTSNTRLKISLESNGGNNFYLDDINVYPSGPTSELQLSLEENTLSPFQLYPNPTEGELTISFESMVSQDLTYSIVDIYGKVIKEDRILASIGNNLIICSTSELAKGSYFIRFNTKQNQSVNYFQVK
ncbi:MAG: T9SS type A sorting domain-containing protein [Crocinitomicaceae bacterium]|nr:T9SS type A sorting domain-containing protein [Crocinitomicaceae bacterium]